MQNNDIPNLVKKCIILNQEMFRKVLSQGIKSGLKYGPSPEGELYPELQDYILAAQNYDETRNGYWPIPLLEEQNNPNLYKK